MTPICEPCRQCMAERDAACAASDRWCFISERLARQLADTEVREAALREALERCAGFAKDADEWLYKNLPDNSVYTDGAACSDFAAIMTTVRAALSAAPAPDGEE